MSSKSNVIPLTKPEYDFGLDSSACGFPVYLVAPVYALPRETPLTKGDYHTCGEHRLIVGCPDGLDTPVAYAAVKKNYGLVNHRDVFANVEASMRDALNHRVLSTCKVDDCSGYNGRDWYRRYTLEGLSHNPDGKSKICFTIYARHSYGAGAMRVMFGETRLVCMNGAVAAEYDCIYRRHSKGFTVERLPQLFERIDDRIQQFGERMAYLEVLGKKPLDMSKIEEYLTSSGFSERRAKTMYEAFVAHALKETSGQTVKPTVLQLYHFLTYYASHNVAFATVRKTEQDNVQMTLLKRQTEIGSLNLETMLNKTRLAA